MAGRFTGPAYPFGTDPGDILGAKDDQFVVLTSMVNIITTPKGSVPHNPAIGSDVPGLLFDINNEITQGLIKYSVIQDVQAQEPRIIIHNVRLDIPQDGNTIIVQVSFSVIGDALQKVHSAPILFPTIEG